MSEKSKSVQDRISVAFPVTGEDNPYHRLLLASLREQGINTVGDDIPILFPLIRTALRNEKIDVIHLDWLHAFYMTYDFSGSTIIDSIITYIRALLTIIELAVLTAIGQPVVWTVHNKLHHEQYHRYTNHLVNYAAYRLVDRVVVKCETAKHSIEHTYKLKGEKIEIVRDGNYIKSYENSTTKSECRGHLSINEDSFVYVYFGQIRPYKGVEYLIDEFKDCSLPRSELWIVGNPMDESIEQRILEKTTQANNITTCLEYIPDERVQYYLNSADILVFPYNNILNSGSVHLGLSFGRPIIAPKLGCIPAVVPNEENILYDPKGDSALKGALYNAYQSINIDKRSEENIKRARELDWSGPAKKYAEVYISVQN